MRYPKLAKEIIQMARQDLAMRDELIQKGELFDSYHPDMAELHGNNAKRLQAIMREIGYPNVDKVGEEGSEATWLLIQHSIEWPDFMRDSAYLLEKEVENEQANPIQLAFLQDRIASLENKPQRYGTQFDWDENGEMNPKFYDDLELVNQRRERIGLRPLEEHILFMREQLIKENQSPPADFHTRKKEIEEWRKKVGWTQE